MGIVDFDTCEGTDEFLWACDQLEVRGTVSLETLVFLPEFSDRVITSRGQPGVAYYLLSGFTAEGSSPSTNASLSDIKGFMTRRNTRIVQTLNDYLHPLKVDYEADVVSLSAGETPTERHLMEAYYQSAISTLDDPVAFWSEYLGVENSEIKRLQTQPPSFRRLMRDKLIKSGGIAYQTPDASNYPPIELINQLSDQTGTLPTLVWGSGASEGEREEAVLLEFLVQKGLLGLNIVPDRSVNVPDSEKVFKLKCLHEVVSLAAQLDLSIFIGTEMNMPGHKAVDDLTMPDLAPFKQTFMEGAYLLHAHTLLARHAGLGYRSDWSADQFADRRSRNDFYAKLGARLPNTAESRDFLTRLPTDLSPRDLLNQVNEKFTQFN